MTSLEEGRQPTCEDLSPSEPDVTVTDAQREIAYFAIECEVRSFINCMVRTYETDCGNIATLSLAAIMNALFHHYGESIALTIVQESLIRIGRECRNGN